MNDQIPTPRTDAALIDNADITDWGTGKSNWVSADFARQLEKELSAAKAQLKSVDESLERCKTNHAVFSLIYLLTHHKKNYETDTTTP